MNRDEFLKMQEVYDSFGEKDFNKLYTTEQITNYYKFLNKEVTINSVVRVLKNTSYHDFHVGQKVFIIKLHFNANDLDAYGDHFLCRGKPLSIEFPLDEMHYPTSWVIKDDFELEYLNTK